MALFKRPDGEFVDVPDAQVQAASERGYEPASEEQFKASQQTGRATLEGAARGLTMGFGEPVISEFQKAQYEAGGASPEVADEAARKAVKLRKEENPVASGAAEFAGLAAPAVLAPEASIPKLLGGGVRGVMAEGGLMGLGQLVSESSLENTPLDVEKAAVGIGLGALTAGAVSKSFELVGQGVSTGLKKLGGANLSGFLKSHADNIEAQALGISDHPYRDEMLKVARDFGIAGGGRDVGSAAAAAKELAAQYPAKMAEAAGKLDEYVPLDDEMRSLLSDYVGARLESQFGNKYSYESALEGKFGRKLVEDLRSRKSSWKDLWDLQSSLWKEGEANTAEKEVREAARQAIRDFTFDEAASGKPFGVQSVRSAAIARAAEKGEVIPVPARSVRIEGDLPETGGAGGVFTFPDEGEAVQLAGAAAKGSESGVFGPPISHTLHIREPIPSFQFHAPELGRMVTLAPGEGAGNYFTSAVPELVARLRGDVPEAVPGMRLLQDKKVVGAAGSPRTREALTELMPAPHDVRLGGAASEAVPGGLVFEAGTRRSAPVGFGGEMRRLGQEQKAVLDLANALASRADKLSKDGAVLSRPAEAAIFGVLAHGPIGGAGAAASSFAADQLKKRGGFMLGSVMRGIADSQVMQGVAKKLSQRVQQVLTEAPGAFGAARTVFEKALMHGEEAVLEAYLRESAADPTGQIQTTLGLYPESPEETEAAGHRMAALSAIKGGATGVEASIDESINGFLKGKAGRPASYRSPNTKDLLDRMEAMRTVLRDPTAAYQMLPPEVTGAAPALSAQLTNQLVTAARFLDSKAPKNPYEALPESIRPAWQPNELDVQRWYRYAEAIESPQKVLERMSQGSFMPEHAEALRAVYPALYEDMQRKMFERLAAWDKGPVPYQKKLMLAQMFGPQILGIDQQQMQILQGAYPRDMDAPASKGGTRPDGRQNIDAAKNQMTQAQRIEGRDAMNPRGQ